MEPFTSFKAIAVPIDIPNCDTDQIIPVRFVRMAQDDPDYPKFFLHDLRFQGRLALLVQIHCAANDVDVHAPQAKERPPRVSVFTPPLPSIQKAFGIDRVTLG